MIRYIAALSLVFAAGVVARPNGAPEGACDSMSPDPSANGHNANAQPLNTFPYTVSCSRGSNNRIEMRVTAAGGVPAFRGILAQVRIGNTRIGTIQTPGGLYQSLCGGQGVTHNSPVDKRSATFNFVVTPAQFAANNVQCVVTVVQTAAVYWVQNRQDLTGAIAPVPQPASPPAARPRASPRSQGRQNGGRRGLSRAERRRRRQQRRMNRMRGHGRRN